MAQMNATSAIPIIECVAFILHNANLALPIHDERVYNSGQKMSHEDVNRELVRPRAEKRRPPF